MNWSPHTIRTGRVEVVQVEELYLLEPENWSLGI